VKNFADGSIPQRIRLSLAQDPKNSSNGLKIKKNSISGKIAHE